MEGLAQEKAKGHLGEIREADSEVGSAAQAEGKRVTASNHTACSWVRQQSEGPHR